MLFAMIATTIFSFSACEGDSNSSYTYEDGDFIYWLRSNCCNTTEKHLIIEGLTEQGKNKKVLVVPKENNGYIVMHLGIGVLMWGSWGNIESQNLERFYAEEVNRGYYGKDPFASIAGFFDRKTEATPEDGIPNPNLEKIILKCVIRKDFGYGYGWVYNRKSPMENSVNPNWWSHEEYTNVSYWLNYESENLGLYWVDDFDYGTAITYIPENPIREGYIFDGWYKEPECINEWDFETDTLPQAKYNEQEEEIHQETKLYVKWIEN